MYISSASSGKESLVYSYERSFNGFAAKLTNEEASRISGKTYHRINN